jgi:hypothetical protein
MVLNDSDFWECPVCHLQAHSASPGMFTILRTRGAGNLREKKATDGIVGWTLQAGKQRSCSQNCEP